MNLNQRERAYPIAYTECSNDTECAEKALQIQAREAAIAEAAVEVAVFQFALAAASIFLIGLTAFYAHRAWVEARTSAEAATAGIDHLKVIERAYLYGGVETAPLVSGQATVELRFNVANHGKTPARLREFWLGVFPPVGGGLIAYPTSPDYSRAKHFICDTIFSAGEGAAVIHRWRGAPPQGIAYAQLQYQDVFGQTQISRFALRYDAVAMTADIEGGDEWNHCT